MTRHLVALKPIRHQRVEYKPGDTLEASDVDARYYVSRGMAEEKIIPKKFNIKPEPAPAPIIEPAPEPIPEPVAEVAPEPQPVAEAAEPVEAPVEAPAPAPRRRGRPARSIFNSLVGNKDDNE